MRKLCKYISIFSLSLSRLSRQSFLKTRESALYSLKSPISRRYIQGTEDNLYQVGCLSVRIYKCLAILNEYVQGQPIFFIKNISYWLPKRTSLKSPYGIYLQFFSIFSCIDSSYLPSTLHNPCSNGSQKR